MTREQRLELIADELIMGATAGRYPLEAEDDGDAMLRKLDREDPPARVVVLPYMNIHGERHGERHGKADVFTRGERLVWTESTHCYTSPPHTLAAPSGAAIRRAAEATAADGRARSFMLLDNPVQPEGS